MKKGRIVAAVVAAFVAVGTNRAGADSAADRCGGTKTKATARYAKSLHACHAAALRSGEAVDSECTGKAVARLNSAFNNAELLGGCVTADDEGSAESFVDDARAAVDALVAPDPTDEARACASTKLKAAGRYLSSRLSCYGKPAGRSAGPNQECLDMANERLVSSFSSAETRGGCTVTGDLDDIRGIEDDALREIVAAL